MLTHRVFLLLVVALAAAAPAFADNGPCAPWGRLARRGASCAPAVQYVQKTIMCPEMSTENRVITCTECRPEVRTYTCTVYQVQREVQAVQRQCTVMVPQTQRQTVTCMVSKPVWTDEVRNYTVMVPYTEQRTGTRMVCQMVPVQETRTVCEDQGHWEERPCQPAPAACGPVPPACGPCAPAAPPCGPAQAMPTQKVWVSKMVQKQVPVTCMRPQMVSQQYNYCVNLCRAEQRSCTVPRLPLRASARAARGMPRGVRAPGSHVDRECDSLPHGSGAAATAVHRDGAAPGAADHPGAGLPDGSQDHPGAGLPAHVL